MTITAHNGSTAFEEFVTLMVLAVMAPNSSELRARVQASFKEWVSLPDRVQIKPLSPISYARGQRRQRTLVF